jgi:hypothetical protein
MHYKTKRAPRHAFLFSAVGIALHTRRRAKAQCAIHAACCAHFLKTTIK